MKENCLDIGTIQAFLDSELDPARSSSVSSHIAACDSCASMLSQAEDESALVFSALEREFDSLVPTQRLWGRINTAIETERREAPIWQKAWAHLRLSLISPSMAIAASVILIIGVFGMIWFNKTAPETNTPAPEVAQQAAPAIFTPPATDASPSAAQTTEPTVQFERASYRPDRRRSTQQYVATPAATTSAADYMPGEESYVKTIANLAKTVEQKKDDVLRPSQRIAYERDMAVVDDAIAKMRDEVKKNPKNESARQVLYSSYQNKIALLNSVSQKEELMASLR
jgi:hypothetical protein